MTCRDLVDRSQIGADHHKPLRVYSLPGYPTLRRTLVVNLIYWFAQSVPIFSGSTTQPSLIPRVLYSAKPRPYLGLHPCGAVHNSIAQDWTTVWRGSPQCLSLRGLNALLNFWWLLTTSRQWGAPAMTDGWRSSVIATDECEHWVGQMIHLKPELIEAYKKIHAAVWPEVSKQINDGSIWDCMPGS